MTKPFVEMEPVATLLMRVWEELSADFVPDRPLRVSRAPGRLDVMGGIADYTGSLVCEATLDHAAAVALQEREDRQIQVFSFNLLDEHRPFTLRIPIDALTTGNIQDLRREFAEPGRQWAGYLVGCLFVLHEQGYIDLSNPQVRGLNLALNSTVPLGAGVSSSAAIEVATMINLAAHFGIDGTPGIPSASRLQIASCKTIDPMKLAVMCQQVENRVVGAPCGVMDQVTSCYGQADTLLRMICQPHEIQPPLTLPESVRAIGINSNVKHSVGGGQYGRTRCAAFMGHKIILQKMGFMGKSMGMKLDRDPMNGYLANLDPEDYKKLFRPFIPDLMTGELFLAKHGDTIDTATTVEPGVEYAIQHATDHHVLEARRIRKFAEFLESAALLPPGTAPRKALLDKAGHLMYGSHVSYTKDAMLGADECDLLVAMVRQREREGLNGAKITGGGSGGTVAVLCDIGDSADAAIQQIMADYEKETGRKPQAFLGSSPGAWHVGTHVITK
jgi:L-arabinokinase